MPSHPWQHSSLAIGRGHMQSVIFPHYHLAAPSGASNRVMMPLAAHSHPHRQPNPHSSQRPYPLMPRLPTRLSFTVPGRPGLSEVIRSVAPHAHPRTVRRVERSSDGATRALPTEQEQKRIEALIHAQNVSCDNKHSREEHVNVRR